MALNPHQKNKVDISSLSEEEQKLFRLYGKLPNKKDLFSKKLSERKYFDSGDYAMSKAGKSDELGAGSLGGGLGREHPTPENIPHLSQVQSASSQPGSSEHRPSISSGTGPALTPTVSHGGMSGSPVKESALQRGMSVDDNAVDDDTPKVASAASHDATGIAAAEGVEEKKGVPIRH